MSRHAAQHQPSRSDIDRGLQYFQQLGQALRSGSADSENNRQLDRRESMHIGEFSTSKYLKQQDIDAPKLVTIDHVKKENVARPGEDRRDRAIIYFAELEKGLVTNATNLKRAAAACGSDETNDWIGKKIVIYVDTTVEMGGEIVGGLRLRPAKLKPPLPAKPAQSRREAMAEIDGMDSEPPF